MRILARVIPVLHLVQRFYVGGAERQFIERLRAHPQGFTPVVGCLEISGGNLADFQTTAFVLPLAPGQGLHFPVAGPHWVKNGPEVSISFSITFRTDDSERRALLYKANARLRRLGLKPTPVGRSILLDRTKQLAFGAAASLKRALLAAGA